MTDRSGRRKADLPHADLLIELGTEELPPKALQRLSDAFSDGIVQGLHDAGLEFDGYHSFATPRRLAVLIGNLATAQDDREVERRGPAVASAFDDNGDPKPAALGFAKSCAVEVADLQRVDTGKGEYLTHKYVEAGRPAAELLPGILEESIKRMPIPKRMRWGELDESFVRPVQWLVVLLGDEVVAMQKLGVDAGRATRGHRFHAPGGIELAAPGDYEAALKRAQVIANFGKRRERIRELVLAAADELSGEVIMDEALLDEVTALVEWPVPVTGHFDERFLEMPKEVLVTAMQEHQRYFCLEDDAGRLLPAFITVSNLQSRDPQKVREGNERVVRPRLEDAMFFWNQDRKKPLADFVPGLDGVTFVKKLGSLADKVKRVQELALTLTDATEAKPAKVSRAAELAKADLLTDMVFEFTELQGVMGRYYALAAGEDEEVAQAIKEQYMPRYAGDALPATATGRTLALADKLDTLAGIFAIGKRPTGDRDPYALRRAALGVLRILVEAEVSLELQKVFREAVALQPVETDKAEIVTALLDFLMERMRGYFADQGVSAEVFESVRATGVTDPLDIQKRIRAVQAFLQRDEAESLAAAHKRVRNILKNQETGICNPKLFTDGPERELHKATTGLINRVESLKASAHYEEALTHMATLQGPVDAFFDAVMVMTDDEGVRDNRLALLAELDRLCRSVADISRLPG